MDWRSLSGLSGTSRLPQLALVLAIASSALASTPLLRAPSTIRRFDAEMSRAFGAEFLQTVPEPVRRRMRTTPVSVVDLFRGVDFGSPRIVRGVAFAAPDGQALTITVYRPQAEGQFPVIVQVYGGAWQRGGPDDDSEFAHISHPWLRRVRHRLSACTSMDMALSTETMSTSHWDGFERIVSSTAAIPFVWCSWGGRPGAQLAMLAAYQPGAPAVRGVVSYYGPVDLTDGYRHPPRPDPLDVRGINEAFLGGTPDSDPVRYQDASPVSYVTRRLPPTLLIYGRRDQVVDIRFGRLLQERLLATGTQSALLELPWSEHAFDALPSGLGAQVALYYTERFVAWAVSR